jgi:predicted  nucleic acid-binding Zn-ribbon protein
VRFPHLLPALVLTVAVVFPARVAAEGNTAYRLMAELAMEIGPAAKQGLDPGAKAAAADAAEFIGRRYGRGTSGRAGTGGGSEPSFWEETSLRGGHSRTVRSVYDPETRTMTVTVTGDAGGKALGPDGRRIGAYTAVYAAGVEAVGDVLRVRPGSVRLTGAMAEDLSDPDSNSAAGLDLNGRWFDRQGRQWIIEHRAGGAGKDKGAVSMRMISGERGEDLHFRGALEGFVLRAEHLITKPGELNAELPEAVRSALAAKKRYRYGVELRPLIEDGRADAMEGFWSGLKVTYSPLSNEISKVFEGYRHHLRLYREKAEEDREYRFVRVRVAMDEWRRTMRHVADQISALEERRAKIEQEIESARSNYREAENALDGIKAERARLVQRIFAVKWEMGEVAGRRQGVKEEDEIRTLRSRILLAEQSVDALERRMIEGDEVEENRKRIELLREDLTRYRKRLGQAEQALAAKKETRRFEERRAERLRELEDELEENKKRLAGLGLPERNIRLDMDGYKKRMDAAADRLQEIDRQIPELRARYAGLDPDGSPFVKEVRVLGADELKARFVSWAPFEAVLLVRNRAEEFGRLADRLGRIKTEAFERYRTASLAASAALDRVNTAIWRSGLMQMAVDSGFFLFDVGRKFVTGGPAVALADACGKAADNYVSNAAGEFAGTGKLKQDYGFSFETVSDEELAAMRERITAGYALDKKSFTGVDHAAILSGRAAIETVLPKLKDGIDGGLRTLIHDYMGHHNLDRLKSGIRARLPVDAAAKAAGNMEALNEVTETVASDPGFASKFRDVVKELGKDYANAALKNLAENIERNAWIDYFQYQAVASRCHATWLEISRVYWKAVEDLGRLRAMAEEFGKNYDPNSEFKRVVSKPVEAGAPCTIVVEPGSPGRRVEVRAGGRTARPMGDYRYEFVPAGLAAPGGDLVLDLEFVE